MTRPVVVVGSVNVDLVTRAERLPGPGETVIGGTFAQHLGGKGANQAVAAARLGAPTWLVGLVGRDPFGDEARGRLRAEGVNLDQLGAADEPTGVALIVVDAAAENQIVVASGANACLSAAVVERALDGLLEPGAVVLANLEVPDEAVLAAGRVARAAGARFVLNPAPGRPLAGDLIACCSVITPNEHELPLVGHHVPSLIAAGAEAVIVTRGAAGADLWSAEGRLRQAAYRVEPVDTTGAGDAFNGALAWALANGQELRDALRAAVAAGALATLGVGAQAHLPDRSTLERFLSIEAEATRRD